MNNLSNPFHFFLEVILPFPGSLAFIVAIQLHLVPCNIRSAHQNHAMMAPPCCCMIAALVSCLLGKLEAEKEETWEPSSLSCFLRKCKASVLRYWNAGVVVALSIYFFVLGWGPGMFARWESGDGSCWNPESSLLTMWPWSSHTSCATPYPCSAQPAGRDSR